MLLEASAAVLIAKCFRSYYIWVVGLWPAGQSSCKVEVTESNRDTTALISQHHANPQEAQLQVLPWDHIEIVSMSLSSLSLVLVATDESGMTYHFFTKTGMMSPSKSLHVSKRMTIY